MAIIKTFTDLATWQEGHKLVIAIYKTTNDFPAEEKFGLTNQLKRAIVSVTSNIAEGFSRNTDKEKAQFYRMALGSLMEVKNQIIIARDLLYVSNSKFSSIENQIMLVGRLINGLIKSANKMQR